MTNQPSAKKTELKRAPRIAGICRAANELSVSRQHLQAVLANRRESKPLLDRYRELKRQEREQLKRHVAQLPAIAAENHSAPLDPPNTA